MALGKRMGELVGETLDWSKNGGSCGRGERMGEVRKNDSSGRCGKRMGSLKFSCGESILEQWASRKNQ